MSDTQAKPVMDTTLKIERDLIAELRKAAEQIAAEGHAGWGDACRDAAQTLASKEAELASREAEIARLRDALHIICAQSIAEDWTAAEALGFVKSHARAALTTQPKE